MCGIVGVVSGSERVSSELVKRMRDTLLHRGPDDSGLYCSPDGRVVLGSRRLSIIDLSVSGHQPMSNESGDAWITYNGEIYNYRDLTSVLQDRGHKFSSTSDTEVIVHSYEEWGDNCAARLRGIFGFAIWDQPRSRLLVARDHLGVKPVYYWFDGKTFLFASELRALLPHPRVRRDLDPAALADYLVYGYVPSDRSIFRGIRKLPPGHVLVLEHGRLLVRRFWEPAYVGDVRDEANLVAMIRDEIHRSITMQLVSDVKVGCFLSGGIDSSTVATIASRAMPYPLQTFSLGFDVKRYDELDNARSVANRLLTRHEEAVATVELAATILPLLAETYDEPFFDTSSIATYEVSKLAAKHVKVVLSGDGGDEVFGGYTWYSESLSQEAFQQIAVLKPFHQLGLALITGGRGLPLLSRLRPFAPYLYADPVQRYFHLRALCDRWDLDRVLGPDTRSALADYEPEWLVRAHFHPEWPRLLAFQYVDLMTYLPDDILVKVDRASMQHSLESRVPLLDHRLVELVLQGAPNIYNPVQPRKKLLRQAVGDELPDGVLGRRKWGFSSPVREWLRGRLYHLVDDYLLRGEIVKLGIVNPQYVRASMSVKAPGRWNRLWQLLELEAWYRRWML